MDNYLREYKRKRKIKRLNETGEVMSVSGFCMACASAVFAESENMIPWATLTVCALLLLGVGCYLTGKYGGRK